MRGSFVLDGFALPAYIEDEDGTERVRRILALAESGRSSLFGSVIGGGEVLCALQRAPGEGGRNGAIRVIDRRPVSLLAPDRAQTMAAAGSKTRHPIAYAHCHAAALATARKARLVTGDVKLRRSEKVVPIERLTI